MKSFAIASAVLMSFAATAAAGDRAVSESTLEAMGLAGMQQMTDQDGLAVRGMGLLDDLGLGALGGFGGGGFTDGFGDSLPNGLGDLQLGDVIGAALENELSGLDLDVRFPPNLGIPSDLGLGALGGLGF